MISERVILASVANRITTSTDERLSLVSVAIRNWVGMGLLMVVMYLIQKLLWVVGREHLHNVASFH